MQPEPKENQLPQPSTTYTNPVDGGQQFSPIPQPPITTLPSEPVYPLANNIAQGSATHDQIKSYKIAAILVVVLCSLPLGIAALIYSNNVEKSLKLGDIEAAKKASKTARLLVIIGVAIGLPLSALYIMSLFHP